MLETIRLMGAAGGEGHGARPGGHVRQEVRRWQNEVQRQTAAKAAGGAD